MRYVALIFGDENVKEIPGVNDWDTMMKGHGEFGAEAGAAGVVAGGEALQATSTATTIRDKNGSDVITDGPFAETKEQLGGFYLIDAANLDEALKWAAKIPHPGGCIEVRPVVDFSAQS
jgi:hypothetical protein